MQLFIWSWGRKEKAKYDWALALSQVCSLDKYFRAPHMFLDADLDISLCKTDKEPCPQKSFNYGGRGTQFTIKAINQYLLSLIHLCSFIILYNLSTCKTKTRMNEWLKSRQVKFGPTVSWGDILERKKN